MKKSLETYLMILVYEQPASYILDCVYCMYLQKKMSYKIVTIKCVNNYTFSRAIKNIFGALFSPHYDIIFLRKTLFKRNVIPWKRII